MSVLQLKKLYKSHKIFQILGLLIVWTILGIYVFVLGYWTYILFYMIPFI